MVYRSDGTIVTDAHVVEDQQKMPFKSVRIHFADGSQASATVVGVDDPTDVAVVKAISPGNSGGAVVNSSSEIIGLSEAYLPPSSGAVSIGFVTPAATVTDVADQIHKSGVATHPVLGIIPTDISPEVANRFGLPTTSGALVIEVAQGGPAAKAGLQPGDIITQFDAQKIANVTDLLAAVRKKEPGQQSDVGFQRGQDKKSVKVTLGSTATG